MFYPTKDHFLFNFEFLKQNIKSKLLSSEAIRVHKVIIRLLPGEAPVLSDKQKSYTPPNFHRLRFIYFHIPPLPPNIAKIPSSFCVLTVEQFTAASVLFPEQEFGIKKPLHHGGSSESRRLIQKMIMVLECWPNHFTRQAQCTMQLSPCKSGNQRFKSDIYHGSHFLAVQLFQTELFGDRQLIRFTFDLYLGTS